MDIDKGIFMFISAFVFGVLFGLLVMEHIYKEQATDLGFAHYDNRTGEWT